VVRSGRRRRRASRTRTVAFSNTVSKGSGRLRAGRGGDGHPVGVSQYPSWGSLIVLRVRRWSAGRPMSAPPYQTLRAQRKRSAEPTGPGSSSVWRGTGRCSRSWTGG
jgi:hypothetical protein